MTLAACSRINRSFFQKQSKPLLLITRVYQDEDDCLQAFMAITTRRSCLSHTTESVVAVAHRCPLLTCLTVSQHAVQFLLQWHPHVLFQTAKHRQIVARYVGVDALCCIIMVWAGVSAIRSPSSPYGKKWHPDEYSQRFRFIFTYYQIKDLMDSILWNDKPELIFHHILSLLSAYGCWSTETGLYYAPFFFGYSELSTIALCCLVNFDLELGIPGLADAFPRLKLIVGVLFVLLFLLCRCLAWPYVSYYFCRDVQQALRRTDDPQLKHRKFWLYFFLVALSGLSLLQVLWLGQIVVTAQKEFLK